MRHGTCFRRRLSARHAGAAPHSAVAELEVVRRLRTSPVNESDPISPKNAEPSSEPAFGGCCILGFITSTLILGLLFLFVLSKDCNYTSFSPWVLSLVFLPTAIVFLWRSRQQGPSLVRLAALYLALIFFTLEISFVFNIHWSVLLLEFLMLGMLFRQIMQITKRNGNA